MRSLAILFQDERYVAINKPSGLLVHRSEVDRSERRFALQLLRDQLGQHVYPVHRLDKPTSGVLLFGLDSEAASRMQALFRHRDVHKEYLAVMRGYLPEEGVIDHPLSDIREACEKKGATQKVRPPQDAVTAYQRLDQTELPFAVGRYPTSRYSLVRVSPETGRKHQIRRHFKHLAHPLVGDTRYGEGRHNRFFREAYNNHRLLLFATRLQFCHPFTGESIEIVAQLPKKARRIFSELGWYRHINDLGGNDEQDLEIADYEQQHHEEA